MEIVPNPDTIEYIGVSHELVDGLVFAPEQPAITVINGVEHSELTTLSEQKFFKAGGEAPSNTNVFPEQNLPPKKIQ